MKWNFFALDFLDSMKDGAGKKTKFAGKKEENSIRKLKIGRWSWTTEALSGWDVCGGDVKWEGMNFEWT